MNLLLAPIQGMTTAFYRQLYCDIFGGIDHCYAPFISTTHMRKKNSLLFEDILPENNGGSQHLIPQLLGNNGKDFRFFASTIADMGYQEINWNIGCPYLKITRKKKGSGLLPHTDLLKEFLDEVCKDTHYTISVKMRLGLDHQDEGRAVMAVLNDYPLASVILHGRIGQQKYEGTVNLEAFDQLYALSNHKMVYNGDLFTVADYHKLQKRYPKIHDYMIGRGALRDPFLASEIKGLLLSPEEKKQKLKDFHDAVYTYNKAGYTNDHLLCNKMKEFWTYTSYQIDGQGHFLGQIRQAKNLRDYEAICDQLFLG